jgi:superfamily II DNA or RNA helicase
MLDELIKKYQLLNEESRKIVNFLALTGDSLSKEEIVNSLNIPFDNLNEILKKEVASGLIVTMNSFHNEYIANIMMTIWLFPLIYNKNTTIYEKKPSIGYYVYSSQSHRRLLNYLYALCFDAEKLQTAENDFYYSYSDRNNIHHLQVLFRQPLYDEHIDKLSDRICALLYSTILSKTVHTLDSFEQLSFIDDKMPQNKSPKLNYSRTEVAIIQGDFEQARKLTSCYRDEPFNYFVEAIIAFIYSNNTDNALLLFEQGMKKQRRTYRNKYIPVMPEIAMFYLAACISKGQEFYRSVFLKMSKEKGEPPSLIYHFFRKTCACCVEDMEISERTASYLKGLRDNPSEQILWRAIAIGLIGESIEKGETSIVKYVRKAFDNKYYVLAYEAAYLLTQWFPSDKYHRQFEDIAAKLNYKPALAHVNHPDAWEKQLNAYFSLEAIQMAMRKETDDGNSRVAYRFYPENNNATPILQTRNAAGIWSGGRNIALNSFSEHKVECMTAHDKRIAACSTNYYGLDKAAIAEMVGHPYVFLENSDILVELIAAQPVISAVSTPEGMYKIECDIRKPREGILIQKETNTRYKIYNLTKFQYDIIKAISKGKPIPKQGYEKLMQILKHFSLYAQVQSDLIVDEDDVQIRDIVTDSRIRIQLLPMGNGIKAELFVKPFGTHPPYCKPGRGGRLLIANEDGERVRVTRNLNDENVYAEQILVEIQSIDNLRTADDGLMAFDNPLDALELLDILERHQDISVVEWPEGERLKIRRKVSFGDVSIRLKSNINWFELEGELKVDEDTVLTVGMLLEMVRNGHGRFVELSNGEFLALSDQLRRRLAEIAAFSAESKDNVILNRFASASMIDAFDNFENLKVDKAWSDFRKRLQMVQLSNAPVPALLQAELRPYQISGYQWMIRLSEWGAGACLADDMGLGKTVQTIAVLLHRAHIGAAMVVAPVSVMPNWISEVNRFAPTLNVRILRNADRETTLASLEPGDLLVTSYGLLLSEEKAITSKQWATVILDEAHAIKNYNTKTSKAAMSLQADFRVILTGTPIQNHLGEIWNLFQFINPGLLGSLSHFSDTFIRPEDEKVRNRLKKLITPFILRRTKTAVLEELPAKTEIICKITLSDEEVAFYEMLRRKAIEFLERDDSAQGAKHLKVLAEITRLRQACCNPALVYPEVTIESTKLSTFLEIASELKDNGHRALIFSQFVSHLSIVRKALDDAGYTYCYLDGSTSVTKRASEVRDFQNGQGDFFLISLKAGGLGLNLTAADYVIHLDPWWNPAIEDQASDRAHRIGQTRPVTVYRLVAEHTIEEKIIRLHDTKRDLANSLLEGSDKSAKLSIDELMSLIKG